jgi:uridine kinase
MPTPPGRLAFVGGLSRSGKSSVASTLAREWRQQGLDVSVLRADRWLRSEADRQPGVLGRYDTDEIERVVRLLGRGTAQSISMPYYSRRKRQRVPSLHQTLRVGADAVVIVEGVVAIDIARRCGMLDVAIDVRADERCRKGRVMHEYEVRGWARPDAESLYASREHDEHQPLRELGRLAASSISLDDVLFDNELKAQGTT